MFDCSGQTALITGGAKGIGFAIAQSLVSVGSNVAIVDVDDPTEALEALRNMTSSAKVKGFVCDVRERDSVNKTVSEIESHFGRIDTLVNNAGTVARVRLDELEEDVWDRDIETNLKGTYLFTQAVLYPNMVKHGSGSIINISSISGMMGGAPSTGANARSGASYAASKGGVIAFTKWVAKEVGTFGIRCNSVAPGPIETSMTVGQEYDFGGQAIKRMGKPEEIGHAVVYLASPGSSFVTGQVLPVCGGSVL